MRWSLGIRPNDNPVRFFAIAILVGAFAAGSLCYAQETVEAPIASLSLAKVAGTESQPADQTASQKASAPAGDDWHVVVAPYLWFPGVHGTVGALGELASVHASATDLLSHFRFGLMGAAEFRYKRFVVPLDLMWVRLGDDTALPVNEFGATSANSKVSELLLTPKIGYQLIHGEMLRADVVTGFRYWHLSQNTQFSPPGLGLDFSVSQNWADPLVGGQIVTSLSPKIEVTVAGDVGGWDVGSQLEYQVVGLLGYRIKPAWALQVGYRYLDVNYRGSEGFVFDTAMSGILFGVTIKLK